MHITIHIFPDSFPIDPESWKEKMKETFDRIEDIMLDATVNANAAALGKTTLIDTETSYVIATINIEKSP